MTPQRPPKILLTNDDGVHSPGLLAALEAVSSFAEVTIIAPLVQQTGMGRAKSGNPAAKLEPKILSLNGKEYEAFACDASPAKAVDHGFKIFTNYKPDLIVSGINYGENLGANVTSSGTVGAAMEGACRGIPAIAASLETPLHSHFNYTEQNWQIAIHFLRYFVQTILEKGLPAGVDVLKLDVPSCATIDSPWRLTSLSNKRYYLSNIPNASIDSVLGSAITTKNLGTDEDKATDIYAIAVDKVVSVTPLTLDFTAHESFKNFKDWA